VNITVRSATLDAVSFDLGQLLEKLKTSPVFILLSLLGVLISALITISTLGSTLLSKIRHKRILLNKLNRLSAGVNIDYFQTVLGDPPVFKTTLDQRCEHIFVNRYFYVQAITNMEDSVIVFSVTTRTRRFNPVLTLGPYSLTGESLRVRLGRTKFAETDVLVKSPKLSCWIGAHSFHYFEESYFGNPANYQTFIFAINDAGYMHHPPISGGEELSIEDPSVKEFRREAVINTYTITAPSASGKDLKGFWCGPNYNEVRILDGYARVSRRELRRLREALLKMQPPEYNTTRKSRRDAPW
jgi:hypothetical protein